MSACLHQVLGRDKIVDDVVACLMEHRCAVVWGPAGEGKTAVALEVARWLSELGYCAHAVSTVDFEGACTDSF